MCVCVSTTKSFKSNRTDVTRTDNFRCSTTRNDKKEKKIESRIKKKKKKKKFQVPVISKYRIVRRETK